MKQTEQTAVRLERDFFLTDGITLAKKLLGKIMVHETADGPIRAVITETEAYMGAIDKGSHAYGGRRTNRTETMFHIGGTSYVYLIYGMYFCMNVVANEAEIPQAVLIGRAGKAVYRHGYYKGTKRCGYGYQQRFLPDGRKKSAKEGNPVRKAH